MTNSDRTDLARLVAALAEVYQPIYGHPELSGAASRTCVDRYAAIRQAYEAIAECYGRALRVLDLGCAQGYFSLNLGALGARVTAIDISPENIAVCQALATEANLSNVEFRRDSIESIIGSLQTDEYDLVLGLSVFHHLVHTAGPAAVRDRIAILSRLVAVAIFELALDSEPMPWAASQLGDERSLLSDYAFAHEIGRFGTHLSEVSRPLLVTSNRLWYLDGRARFFASWKHFSHELAGDVTQGTRRYYEGDGIIAKVFQIDRENKALAEINIRELDLEARFLEDHPAVLPSLPKLLGHGRNEADAWLIRERIPGTILLELMRRGESYDMHRVIRDTVSELAILEAAGLYHNDVRAWNVIVGPDGAAHLLDFGAISEKRQDCLWPNDPIMSFWLFVHDVATGDVERIFPHRQPFISPMSLPAPFRDWALAVWEHPVDQWSFGLLLRCLDGTKVGSGIAPHATMLWMKEIEGHIDGLGAHALDVETATKENASRLQRADMKVASIADTVNALVTQANELQTEAHDRALEIRKQFALMHTEFADLRTELLELRQHVVSEESMRSLKAEVETRFREIATSIGTAIALGTKLEGHLTDRLTESERTSANLTHELAAISAAYKSIEQSRSWRLTLPLRLFFQTGRKIGSHAKLACKGFVRLPRRIASNVLRAFLAYVRADPRRKQNVARLLRNTGWLDARLRLFARGNPVDGIPAVGRYAPGEYAQSRADASTRGGRPVSHSTREMPTSFQGNGADELDERLRNAVSRWPLGKRIVHD